jgi:hypothetical protein
VSVWNRAVRRATLALFPVAERLGVHVLPNHFYYPVPDSAELTDELFARVSSCPGLEWNDGTQREYVTDVFPRYVNEVPFSKNEGLSLADAAILHAMIRHHRPKQMIEIGSGHSTEMACRALGLNHADGFPGTLLTIDPYASADLERRLPAYARVRRDKVQAVPPEVFADCDLLFIDSSHVAGIASDVTFEQLEIVPRVKTGCLVHFHDILLPGEYWKEWVVGHRLFWSEQYLLRAFLLFNRAFRVVWASRYMQLTSDALVQQTFPFYRSEHHITSFWIQRVDA